MYYFQEPDYEHRQSYNKRETFDLSAKYLNLNLYDVTNSLINQPEAMYMTIFANFSSKFRAASTSLGSLFIPAISADGS